MDKLKVLFRAYWMIGVGFVAGCALARFVEGVYLGYFYGTGGCG